MDEAALTGMTLTASPPTLERSEEACAAAADELSALGACAHARPEPLHVKTIGRRRFGRLVYERLTFEHDPLLPPSLAGSGLGGPTTAAVHLCRQGDDRRPWLVWVHGAGQGQPLDLLFSRARRIQSELGFNIALPVQPGHGVRREAWPAYPNMDPSELVKMASSFDFEGSGKTERAGKLNGLIGVRVKQELPNGDLFVEGTKVVMINHEEQHLYVSGVIRTSDIAPDNSVDSSLIADARVEFTGRGDINDQVERGWLNKILDFVNPF